jgi:hypothetical protein
VVVDGTFEPPDGSVVFLKKCVFCMTTTVPMTDTTEVANVSTAGLGAGLMNSKANNNPMNPTPNMTAKII